MSYLKRYPNFWPFNTNLVLTYLHGLWPSLYHKIPVPEDWRDLEHLQPNVFLKHRLQNTGLIVRILDRTLETISYQSLNNPLYGRKSGFQYIDADIQLFICFYPEFLDPSNIITSEELTELLLTL